MIPGVIASGRMSTAALQAVRFDASADKYSRSATGLGATDLTMCCWFKIVVDRNAVVPILAIDNAGAIYAYINTTATGTNVHIDAAGGGLTLFNATVGTWYFVAYMHTTAHTATKTAYYAAQGDASLTNVGNTTINTDITDACTFFIAGDGFADWNNGSIAQVRVWSAILNSTQINLEYHSSSPVRASNLWAAYSFASGPQTTDDSGNGRTLTAAGTLTADTSGPTIT